MTHCVLPGSFYLLAAPATLVYILFVYNKRENFHVTFNLLLVIVILFLTNNPSSFRDVDGEFPPFLAINNAAKISA